MSEITHLLIHTVDVQRNTPVSLGEGKFRDEFNMLHAGMAFRVAAMSASEITTAQQLKTYSTHNGYGEPGIDIARGDRVVHGSDVYHVTAVLIPSVQTHHTKVTLQKIDKGK
jgi:hypothetical protein